MEDYYVDDVPYFAQETSTTCWNAAYKMMLKYKDKPTSYSEVLPNHVQMRSRGILDSEFASCRDSLGLSSSTYKGLLTLDGIRDKLEMYGPIWVSGQYCESSFKHIVVLRGVRDPWYCEAEVCINDPYSGFVGAKSEPRWIPFKRFVAKINAVQCACQHW